MRLSSLSRLKRILEFFFPAGDGELKNGTSRMVTSARSRPPWASIMDRQIGSPNSHSA